ncbi:hypothetical protein PCANC_25001 [Puccinia coronata f. sp. avenae]|uniref:Uncharacterized protein n=1 Tax=Puccinia coronata f. sp. avenae TaxID=200324 RepID=A0A2N5SJL6_9BASI|nr:hypothetical protein PCANC_25001 [Puccinia coronata f. sp. avenae]
MADLLAWDPALVDTDHPQLRAVAAELATTPTSSANNYPSPRGETPDPPCEATLAAAEKLVLKSSMANQKILELMRALVAQVKWCMAYFDAKMKLEEQEFIKAHIQESLRHANTMNKLGHKRKKALLLQETAQSKGQNNNAVLQGLLVELIQEIEFAGTIQV